MIGGTDLDNMATYDDAIVSLKPAEKGGPRELQKTNWASSGELLETLEDIQPEEKKGNGKNSGAGKSFNQFKGKSTTYKDETYSTKIKTENLT